MRKALAATFTLASLCLAVTATSASAGCGDNALDDCSGSTTVAFTVLPDLGSISIVTTPIAAGAGIGETAPTSTGTDVAKVATVPLGVTTVLDGRSSSPGWSMSAAAAAAFSGPSGASIATSKATFAVPAAPVAADSALLTGVLAGAPNSSISSRPTTPQPGGTAILVSSSTGVNAASFVPVMTVDVTGAAAGLYTGSVTQSVS